MSDNKIITNLINDLRSRSYEVRMRAAEKLGELRSKRAITPLANLSKDTDELVRIHVAESLGYIKSRKSIPVLLEMLNDKAELVRGYAAEALGWIGDKSVVLTLEKMLKREKRNATRVRIYIALYLLGQRQVLKLILECLKIRNYRVRCTAAYFLCEIANKSNSEEILCALQKAWRTEATIAAKSAMAHSMREIKKILE